MNHAVLYVTFGALIGFSLGLLGGGGSILTVPILVYVIGQDVHSATGTSLAIVGGSAVAGTLAHLRRGDVRIRSGLVFGLASMTGALPGAWLNRLVEGRLILLLFACLMIAAAVQMLRKRSAPGRRPVENASRDRDAGRPWRLLVGLGWIVGLLTGFFGVGGGFLIVPALVLGGKFPTHQAVGTSLLVIAMASAAGFAGHVGLGTVDLDTVGTFVLGGLAGALLGTGLSSRVSEQKLTAAFAWFTIAVALYLVYRNV